MLSGNFLKFIHTGKGQFPYSILMLQGKNVPVTHPFHLSLVICTSNSTSFFIITLFLFYFCRLSYFSIPSYYNYVYILTGFHLQETTIVGCSLRKGILTDLGKCGENLICKEYPFECKETKRIFASK